MSTDPPLFCLNMIVKDEAANLERCLAAVADYISCWVICDTGSSDGTPDLVRSFFAARELPGELHRFPFENFAAARNGALARAAAASLHYDYLLLTDADMELVVERADAFAPLTAAGYQLLQRSANGFAYPNVRLLRRGAAARYVGVTHEYLEVEGELQGLRGAWFKDHASGANRVGKFRRDIALLSAALMQEPDDARSVFYLAQSHRDAGDAAVAIEQYRRRAAMGGWPEEVWYSLYQIGCLETASGASWGQAMASLLAAWQFDATRAEPLYQIAMHYQHIREHHLAHLFLGRAVTIPLPDAGRLFVEQSLYTHLIRLEYAVACYWTGRHGEAITINDRLLAMPDLAPELVDLVRKNREYSVAALGAAGAGLNR